MTFNIPIDSLITYPERITRLVIDLDDGNVYDMASDELVNHIDVTYKYTGTKTFGVSVYIDPDIQIEPFVQTYQDVLFVSDVYDTIKPVLYTVHNTSFVPPVSTTPQIFANDWGVSNVFNKTILQIQDTLDYLILKTLYYNCSVFEYVGWYGVVDNDVLKHFITTPKLGDTSQHWAWGDLECQNPFFSAVWDDFNSDLPALGESCDWGSVVCDTDTPTKTAAIIKVGVSPEKIQGTQVDYNPTCLAGARWHLDYTNLNDYIYNIPTTVHTLSCAFTDMFIKDGLVYTTSPTQLRVQSHNMTGSLIKPVVNYLTTTVPFRNITAMVQGAGDLLYICDTKNNSIAAFNFKPTAMQKWGRNFVFSGLGSNISKYKFNTPTDICTDSKYNLYVSDSGNKCVKVYSPRGEWLNTINLLNTPISLTIDSSDTLHVLTATTIYMYDLLTSSLVNQYAVTNTQTPLRIRCNYNKQMIYVCSTNQIIKFFRNGTRFCELPINLTGITTVYHDSYRDLYIVKGDALVKYHDVMHIDKDTNNLFMEYWSRDDVKIKPDEYVQDWVYNRSFHRVWDNIELFRSCLKYRHDASCKSYTPPTYTKEHIFIAQNEIVTSAVVNRCLKYLWVNLLTMYKYFDTDCS